MLAKCVSQLAGNEKWVPPCIACQNGKLRCGYSPDLLARAICSAGKERNSTLTELAPYALRELVKAVYVDAPDKSSGKRRQKVHIEYDLVGYIPVDELLKAEQA